MVPWSILVGRSLDAPNLAWRAVRAASYAPVRVPFARRALVDAIARVLGVNRSAHDAAVTL